METTNQTKVASLGIRILAAILDSAAVSLAWYWIIETWGSLGPAADYTSTTAGGDKALTGIPAVLLMVATAAFWILPEWLLGATLGKWMCGLRVTSMDGGALTFVQSLKRNVLRLFDFVPFYLTGFVTALLTPNRQRLGDLWAKTIVVPKRYQQAGVARSPSATIGKPVD